MQNIDITAPGVATCSDTQDKPTKAASPDISARVLKETTHYTSVNTFA